MYEWNWKFFFSSLFAQGDRHFVVVTSVQTAALICIVGLFVLGLTRRHRWKNQPIIPGENELPDMWLARCGVWVAVVAFLLGWMPQIGWVEHSRMTGFYYDFPKSAMFNAFGNLFIGSIALTLGFAQYFILQFLLSGVAIERALPETIPVVYPAEDVDKIMV